MKIKPGIGTNGSWVIVTSKLQPEETRSQPHFFGGEREFFGGEVWANNNFYGGSCFCYYAYRRMIASCVNFARTSATFIGSWCRREQSDVILYLGQNM